MPISATPWHVSKTHPRTIVADDGYEVATATLFYGRRPDNSADHVRLIAAAPDLLAALEMIVEQWDQKSLDASRAAIAKARGNLTDSR